MNSIIQIELQFQFNIFVSNQIIEYFKDQILVMNLINSGKEIFLMSS
jgi:hypothetical protein